ncbi:hypothetical protein NQ317_004486 [Molorchus minor]|uniref:Uncharacterized protein n=1 Tax=Molorchus minor TaxID=1323400 RepID=A0ABQ9IUR4_9CUCU|nr:hypothetical protein NQ317_004486 [Molorchus minor]
MSYIDIAILITGLFQLAVGNCQKHFDNHNLWVPNEFAIHTFRIIIFSIQAQYSYTVVETLMAHLDENSKSIPTIRTSIAGVLAKIIAIAAGESVGPSVLEIINSLLSHLRDSVKHEASLTEEKDYQEALINALGEFANHLPDYQKIEIMMYVMIQYFVILLVDKKWLVYQNVGTKYQTIHLNTTFPVSFLEPLLRMSLAPDPDMRLLVQKILHTLIDRHHNLEKLSKPIVHVAELDLVIEKSSRPDLIFINKHGPIIYDALYTSLQMDTNTPENIEAVYTTLALICVEVSSVETVLDLLQLVLGIQSLALNTTSLTNAQKFNLHTIVICLLVLISNIVNIKPLADYASQIVEARQQEAPHLLPELLSHYPSIYEVANKLPHLLVDQKRVQCFSPIMGTARGTVLSQRKTFRMAVCENIKLGGIDPSRLQQNVSLWCWGSWNNSRLKRNSWIENGARGSIIELPATEGDSANSSPGVLKVNSLFSVVYQIMLYMMFFTSLEESLNR